jgi:hypothetical protein
VRPVVLAAELVAEYESPPPTRMNESTGGDGSSTGGGAGGRSRCRAPFVAHGGPYGFFPAAGTNYGVNEEPIIAARLDQLGRALQLHLIGVSGDRSPAHSVELRGFADDPHTHGLASDTPGVEGVAESTLAQFCLTRPPRAARGRPHSGELERPLTGRSRPPAVAAQSRPATSDAARSPERTAPSMYPLNTSEVSLPAQCSRPTGARSAAPKSLHTPGGMYPV